MKYCTHCGAELHENQVICVKCGCMVQSGTPAAPQMPKKRSMNVGMLIFSIVNLLLCCQPLGIIATLFTALATDAKSDEEEHKKLRTAKILNIIGIIGAVVIWTAYIVFAVLLELGLETY